jgi:transcriptional regulator with XRE-family HTH domain
VTAADHRSLGDRIREARKEAGFRNAESLAVALGVGQRTVQRWETDQHMPPMLMLFRIAEMTGKPVEFFFAGEVAA